MVFGGPEGSTEAHRGPQGLPEAPRASQATTEPGELNQFFCFLAEILRFSVFCVLIVFGLFEELLGAHRAPKRPTEAHRGPHGPPEASRAPQATTEPGELNQIFRCSLLFSAVYGFCVRFLIVFGII